MLRAGVPWCPCGGVPPQALRIYWGVVSGLEGLEPVGLVGSHVGLCGSEAIKARADDEGIQVHLWNQQFNRAATLEQ